MARDTSAYRLDGARVVSVTEALKIAGLVQFGLADPDDVEAARQRGDEAHAWIEMIVKGEIELEEDPPPNIAGYVGGYRSFIATSGFKATMSERAFVSQRYRFAGTVDLAGHLNEKYAVLDISCTAQVPPWKQLQTAGYVLGLESIQQIPEDKPLFRGVLWLPGTGSYKLVPNKEHSADRSKFLAALTVAHFRLAWGFATLEE